MWNEKMGGEREAKKKRRSEGGRRTSEWGWWKKVCCSQSVFELSALRAYSCAAAVPPAVISDIAWTIICFYSSSLSLSITDSALKLFRFFWKPILYCCKNNANYSKHFISSVINCSIPIFATSIQLFTGRNSWGSVVFKTNAESTTTKWKRTTASS